MTFEPPIKSAKHYRTHCRSGRHEWTPENVYTDPQGNRHCRACRVEVRDGDRRTPVAFTCSKCGREWQSTKGQARKRSARWRQGLAPYPTDWCRSCVNASVAARRRKPPVLEVVVSEPEPEPVDPRVEWMTAEELEQSHTYWTSRYSRDEIYELAAAVVDVLDTGGYAYQRVAA